jgi:hypothetical protein
VSMFKPGVRSVAGESGWFAVTLARNAIVDQCPHRHKTHSAAQKCAEVLCCFRNGHAMLARETRRKGRKP